MIWRFAKNSLYRLVIPVFLLSFACFGCLEERFQTASLEAPESAKLTQNEISQLKAGDIICRKGFGLVSNLIAGFASEGSSISHCGILVAQSGEFMVLQSLSPSLSGKDGVHLSSLFNFIGLSRKGSVKVFRLHQPEALVRKLIAASDSISTVKIPFDQEFDLFKILHKILNFERLCQSF